MKQKIYLIADVDGIQRMTKRPPTLARHEIGVAVTITMPDSAFRSPMLAAQVEVADEAIIKPDPEIEVEAAELEGIQLALEELEQQGHLTEVSPGRYSLTEWGMANARRLLHNNPEAQELWAQLEANKDRIAAALDDGGENA